MKLRFSIHSLLVAIVLAGFLTFAFWTGFTAPRLDGHKESVAGGLATTVFAFLLVVIAATIRRWTASK